jgi:transcriptional repressor NrdR
MVCPFCLHKKSEIYNTRITQGGMIAWRRRRCLMCGKAFTTEEAYDPSGIWKVKKNNKTAPYSRPKLIMSLLRACDHRKNEEESAWYLYKIIEQRLLPLAAPELTITASQVIEEAGNTLKRFDPAAYIKYLSYHQPAMDTRTLRRHLKK